MVLCRWQIVQVPKYGVIIEFFENARLILIDGVANLTIGTVRYRHFYRPLPFSRISTKAAHFGSKSLHF